MAATSTCTFDGNFYTPGMRSAITFARSAGYQRQECNPAFLRDLHKTITDHELGLCAGEYRQNAVLMGQFKPHEIPHPTQIPALTLTLARDINALLTDNHVVTLNLVARVVSRMIAMQPFQDGNKRTAFSVAAYIMAWRGMSGILIPDKRDNEMFCSAIFNGNEGVVVLLLNRWLAPCP